MVDEAVPLRAERVLIAEDDPRIAAFLLKGLRAKGFDAVWAATGQATLDEVGRGGVDAVLLDLGLPDIDGLEILAGWRHASVTVPVIVLTARSDPRDRVRAHELGVAGYLMKPAPFADVVAAVGSAVGRDGDVGVHR